MLKYGLVVMMLMCIGFTKAQVNLVLNPSFEALDSCPQGVWVWGGSLQYCAHWFTPYSTEFPNGGGSTEVYTDCGTFPEFSTPNNWVGHQQPYSGGNNGGFGLIIGAGREYIEGQLTDTLKTGKRYCIKFYYSFADSSITFTDGLGVLFSKDSLMRLDQSGLVIDTIPTVSLDSGFITIDTMNWLTFEKEFIAQGGEKYFTVGNFKFNNACTIVNPYGGTNYECYIYVDDFSVMLCDSTSSFPPTNPFQFSFTPTINCTSQPFQITTNQSCTLQVFDVNGKTVSQQNFNTGTNNFKLDDELQTGVYFYRVVSHQGVVAGKLLLNLCR